MDDEMVTPANPELAESITHHYPSKTKLCALIGGSVTAIAILALEILAYNLGREAFLAYNITLVASFVVVSMVAACFAYCMQNGHVDAGYYNSLQKMFPFSSDGEFFSDDEEANV